MTTPSQPAHGEALTEATVITLCGSTKFKAEFLAVAQRLTMDGNVVISLGVFGHTDLPDYDWTTDASNLKRTLDGLHFQKIRMADEVYVVDPGGYVGESTRREIEYALSLGKPVRYLSADPRRLAAQPAHGDEVADLKSRLACINEATVMDRPYDTRLDAIRGMCDLSTNGMTPIPEPAHGDNEAALRAVRALPDEWTSATCVTNGAPCSFHRQAEGYAADLRAALSASAEPEGGEGR